MYSKPLISVTLAATLAMFIVGCSDKKELEPVSSACAELEKETDQAKRIALREKCPLSGPSFKRSSGKQW